MNVNSVMNAYDMSSLWNSINPMSNSSSSVPLINNVDNAVKENYTSLNYSGQNTNSELQNIYQQIQPNYGMPFTYDQNGNFSMPTSTSLPTNGLSAVDLNIISLLNSNNSATDNSMEGIMSQYSSIENDTFKPDFSSILSFNPYSIYNAVYSLGTSQSQDLNSTVNTIV